MFSKIPLNLVGTLLFSVGPLAVNTASLFTKIATAKQLAVSCFIQPIVLFFISVAFLFFIDMH